jgi:hypothetical protein
MLRRLLGLLRRSRLDRELDDEVRFFTLNRSRPNSCRWLESARSEAGGASPVRRLLPVDRPGDLVSLYRLGGWGDGFMSYPLYTDLRDQTDVFDGVLALSGVMRRRLGADGSAVQFIESEYVSGNYFSVLGIKPAAGRLLAPDDARARGQSPVAVLSYDAWRSRFALDPAIIGRTLVVG